MSWRLLARAGGASPALGAALCAKGRKGCRQSRGQLLRGHCGVSGVFKRSAQAQAEAGTGV